jgi:hypothetical protein
MTLFHADLAAERAGLVEDDDGEHKMETMCCTTLS